MHQALKHQQLSHLEIGQGDTTSSDKHVPLHADSSSAWEMCILTFLIQALTLEIEVVKENYSLFVQQLIQSSWILKYKH